MRARVWLLLVLAGCKAAERSYDPSAMSAAVERVGAPLLMVDEPGTWRRSTLPVHASRVMVGDDRELPVEQVDMRVEVAGFRARVGVELVFVNPDERVYEATFQMRLADDASPYRLAFGQSAVEFAGTPGPPGAVVAGSGPWEALREAIVAPRRAAATAYDATVNPREVRRVVDPALAEWAGAGVFNMRVFPVAAQRRHRVVFEYDVGLAPSGPDLALELPTPANVPRVQVTVTAPAEVRVLPAVAGSGSPLEMRHVFDRPTEPISLRVTDRPMLLRTRDAIAGPLFAARIVPPLPDAPPAEVLSRAIFAVDTSLSSNPARFEVWLALLREILNANREQLREFAVVFFDVEARWWQPRFVANTPDNVAALLSSANSLALVGATDVGAALAAVATPPWPAQGPWDVFLLSDGAATWGEADVAAAARRFAAEDCADGKCPGRLVAYRTHGVGVDPQLLNDLVRETGGTMISVADAASAASVATAHRRRPWQLADVRVDGGSDVMVAGRPQTVSAGQPLVVVGRGSPPPEAMVRLTLKQGAAEQRVSVAVGPGVESPLATRTFGQVAVGQLEENLAATRSEAEAFARYFAVPGAACSLLMLESEEDYQRRGISRTTEPGLLQAPVVPVIAAAERRAAAEGIDPRPALLRSLTIDGRVARVIEQAPALLLRAPAVPLAGTSSTWRDIPAVLRPQLERGEIDEALLHRHAAEVLATRGAADGLKVLSALAEARPGDAALLRGLAFTALAWGQPEAAYHLLHRAGELAPGEASDDHLMAVALAASGRPLLAMARFEAALLNPTSGRSGAVGVEYIHFLRSRGRVGDARAEALMATRLQELGARMQQPLVVMLHWSGDHADVDLHVVEPDGEDCHYAAPQTNDGRMTLDEGEGRGPEVYWSEPGARGRYQVSAKLFSGTRHRASARMQVLVSVFTDFGGPNERVTRHVATIAPGKLPTPITEVVVP